MNTLLLILAAAITLVLFVPLFIIQSIRRSGTLGEYHLNLAVNIDYVWGALFFGTDGHTVSAVVYFRMMNGYCGYRKYVNAINWLFSDDMHCRRAWQHEFLKRRK